MNPQPRARHGNPASDANDCRNLHVIPARAAIER
jgi:hypothetical protein